MRESNFSNPAQNKACVCISAAVYDRRAIDCTATLPLINSLNHLAYLTSTSPRIREMVTLDGGLERLIRILRTVPKTPSPNARAISIKEMQAIWKWSLAFQCVVNIGVRGSEDVRTRVVEAGMVPVTIRVLESYLRGLEQLNHERKAHESSRREEGASRDRHEDGSRHSVHRSSSSRARLHAASSGHAGAPAGEPVDQAAHVAPVRSESASIQLTADENIEMVSATNARLRLLVSETRPTTPLESDAAATILVNMNGRSSSAEFMAARSSEMTGVDSSQGRGPIPIMDHLDSMPLGPTPVDINSASLHNSVSPSTSASSDLPPIMPRDERRALDGRGPASSGLLTNVSSAEDLRSHGGEASGSGSDGAEDADIFADDADESESDAAAMLERRSVDAEEDEAEDRRTPRPTRRVLAPLNDQDLPPPLLAAWITPAQAQTVAPPLIQRQDTIVPSRAQDQRTTPRISSSSGHRERRHHFVAEDSHAERPHDRTHRSHSSHASGTTPQIRGAPHASAPAPSSSIDMIYREEEVLLSLQLLAYLSKYSHVRTLFHSSDLTHVLLVGPLDSLNESLEISTSAPSWDPSEPLKRNVFSIAEKFTLRSSRSSSSSHPAPRLATEIQYWAGVIMRNACRKDESRGGIRQCANMLCGRWETFPREFAKCRRCRKAKYCSKQCQSKGWQMGHRFWCSSRNDDTEQKEKERAVPPTFGGGAEADVGMTRNEAGRHAAAFTSANASATGTDDEGTATAESHEHHHQHQQSSQADASLTHAGLHHHHQQQQQLQQHDIQQQSFQRARASAQHADPNSGPLDTEGPSTSGLRRFQQVPGVQGLPSTLVNSHLRDRRVSSLVSVDTVEGSDLSDDEIESRLLATRGMHPAIAAAAAAAAAAGARHEGDEPAPIVAPQRTDLAGRPLPPPVIASQNVEEDELALGGRATPGATGEQDFGNGDFDQMLGHWDPSRGVGVTAIGLQQRLATIRAEISSPDRSSSPDIFSASGNDSRSEGRSEDELRAPRARYHAIFGQHPYHPSPLRPHPQHNHRLQQQRSVSGFASAPAHTPNSFSSAQAGPSSLNPARTGNAPSPLAATPVRNTSFYQREGRSALGLDEPALSREDVEMSDGSVSDFTRSIAQIFVDADRHSRASSSERMSSSDFVEEGDVPMET